MRMNSRTNEPIKLLGENVDEVEEFTYLGSKMTADGSSEREIRARLPKAGQAFAALRKIWENLSENENTPFQEQCSWYPPLWIRILENDKGTDLKSFSTDTFAKYSGLTPSPMQNSKTSTQRITLEIKRRRWQWIGHVLRIPQRAIVRTALRWT